MVQVWQFHNSELFGEIFSWACFSIWQVLFMMVAHNKLAERPELSRLSLHFSLSDSHTTVIELDDGKIYRKPLYLMVKTMVSGYGKNHGFRLRFSPRKPIHSFPGAQAAKRSWPSCGRWWLLRGPECVAPQGDPMVVIGGLMTCCPWLLLLDFYGILGFTKHFAKFGQNFPI